MTAPTTASWRARVSAVLWFVLWGSAQAAAVDYCSKEQVKAWQALRTESLGVHAYDPNPFLAPDIVPITDRPAQESCPSEVDFSEEQSGRAHDGIHAWVFAHPCKVAVCGEPQSFEQNRGIHLLSGEYDLNNNLSIRPEFKSRTLDPLLCAPPPAKDPFNPGLAQEWNLALQEPLLCFPDTHSLHVEITPPTSFRPLFDRLWVEQPPWGWLRWRKGMVEQTACVYGPFVADTAHAALAEIHPAQMYWWNERASGKAGPFEGDGPFALFLIQDASNRYTKPHDFVLSQAPPEGSSWKPWAGAPVEAVFEVPFWSPDGKPPRFDLRPYEYRGVTAPAPHAMSCTEASITELKVESNGQSVVVARACNATRADRPDSVEVVLSTICRCEPQLGGGSGHTKSPEGGGCPGEAGFLGTLTITARTGRPKEWREGALGLLLVDSRSLERSTPVVGSAAGATPQMPAESASLLVSWRAVAGNAWRQVEVTEDQMDGAVSAVRALYNGSGWPTDVPGPMTSLWRVNAADLRASLVIPHLLDRQRGNVKLTQVTIEAKATSLLHGATPQLTPQALVGSNAERRLAMDELWSNRSTIEPFRVELTVNAKASYPRPPQVARGNTPTQTSEHLPPSTWVLWTHGLGSQPSAVWQQSTRALCDWYLARSSAGGAASGRALEGPKTDSMVYKNVRIATQRVLKDDVVSVGALTLLVRSVARICATAPTLSTSKPYTVADSSHR